MKRRKIITILIIVNLTLISMTYNLKNIVNVNNQKQVIKEMTENEQVTNLQTQINNLQLSHKEYTNYIQESKSKIAKAITAMGVETSEDDQFETMAENIKNISINILDDIKALYFMVDKPTTNTSYNQLATNVSGKGNKSDKFNQTYQIPIILEDKYILYKITMNAEAKGGASWATSYSTSASISTSLTYYDKEGVLQSITGNNTSCSITNTSNNNVKTANANPTYTVNGVSGLYYTDTVNLNLVGNVSVSYSGETSGTATATISNITCTYIAI